MAVAQSGAASADPAVEAPDSNSAEQVYLAKDDGNGRPGDAATAFLTTDETIHCVVILGDVRRARVRMDLVAAKVPGVKPETKVVSSAYVMTGEEDRVFFRGRPHGRWIAGDYRADIYVDGKLFGKFPFRIDQAQADADHARRAIARKRPPARKP